MILADSLEVARAPALSLAMVSTYPPNRCGIGRFTWALRSALETLPGMSVDVVRITNEAITDDRRPQGVVLDVNPASPMAVQVAARRASSYDVVVVQHEFGIYGPADGAAVIDLVQAITAPVVVVFHTVLREPSAAQRAIVDRLAQMAVGLVALSDTAEAQLCSTYRIDPALVSVIRHGAPWRPQSINTGRRRRLLTWGLLGPGKGIERAIEAVAGIDLPDITYCIAGQVHPNVLRDSGSAYRDSLEDLVRFHGMTDRIEFDDRYLDEPSLLDHVAAADVVVLPYDNCEQISSGVLTDAISAGRPVVATRFPHAIEMLGTGAGSVVDHDDTAAMSNAITSLLTDDVAYRRATEAAAHVGATLSWDAIGGQYAALCQTITRPAAYLA